MLFLNGLPIFTVELKNLLTVEVVQNGLRHPSPLIVGGVVLVVLASTG
jgi:hypothetical protein